MVLTRAVLALLSFFCVSSVSADSGTIRFDSEYSYEILDPTTLNSAVLSPAKTALRGNARTNWSWPCVVRPAQRQVFSPNISVLPALHR